MKQRNVLSLGASIILLVFSSAATESDAPLMSNLVAAVVGYHTTREVADGIRIPAFVASEEVGNTNVCGILFYVIAPTNVGGTYFYLTGDTPSYQDVALKYYRPDRFYWFTLTNQYYDVRNTAFKIHVDPEKELRISTPCVNADVFYTNMDDVLADMERFKETRSEITDKMEKARVDMQLNKDDRRLYRMARSELLTQQAKSVVLDTKILNALSQTNGLMEQMSILRMHIPFGFAWGDTNYFNCSR